MKVGDIVNRIEDREIVGATILEVVKCSDEECVFLIAYDEGGQGWWPKDSLELVEEVEVEVEEEEHGEGSDDDDNDIIEL
jgi:hypothetical protein